MATHTTNEYFQAISLHNVGLSIHHVSSLIGISYPTVKSWLSGRHPHSVQKLLQIKMYFNYHPPQKKKHPWSKGLSADPNSINYDPRLDYTKKTRSLPMLRGEDNPAKRIEVRKKISEALKGRKHSEEQIKKQSDRMKELWFNPCYREKMIVAFRKRKITPARISQLKRLHESLKDRVFTLEWRQKISDAMKGNKNQERKHSEETKKKISDAHKRMWDDPKFRSGLFLPDGRYESREHYLMKMQAKKLLESKCFDVCLEYPIIIDDKRFIIDVYGELNEAKVIVECGYCSLEKLYFLQRQFDNVIHYAYDTNLKIQINDTKSPQCHERMRKMKVLA